MLARPRPSQIQQNRPSLANSTGISVYVRPRGPQTHVGRSTTIRVFPDVAARSRHHRSISAFVDPYAPPTGRYGDLSSTVPPGFPSTYIVLRMTTDSTCSSMHASTTFLVP